MGKLPSYDELKAPEGAPEKAAWGLWDQGAKKDLLGTLNILTPEMVVSASSEISTGHHISLNWPYAAIKTSLFGRKSLVHKPLGLIRDANIHGFDDEVELNTQGGSQWDSLCHFHHQPTALAYNGFQPTEDRLKFSSSLPTLEHWHTRGGLVARAVLLDHRRWLDSQGKKFNCFDLHKITISDLEQVAKTQNVELKLGDVLIIRSGFTEELGAMNADQQTKALEGGRFCGVEGNETSAKWIWNHHFCAVAGDMVAFEHVPPILKDGSEGVASDLYLHDWLIARFGMSIGELWDLKELSEYCAKIGRYSFMLTSIPMNVPGLVGSPPNAIAIF